MTKVLDAIANVVADTLRAHDFAGAPSALALVRKAADTRDIGIVEIQTSNRFQPELRFYVNVSVTLGDFLEYTGLGAPTVAQGPWMTRIPPPPELDGGSMAWVVDEERPLEGCLSHLTSSLISNAVPWVSQRLDHRSFLAIARDTSDNTATAFLLAEQGLCGAELTQIATAANRGDDFVRWIQTRAQAAARPAGQVSRRCP